MKALLFFPLAYLAGVHGFALFAPYAAFSIAVWLYARHRKQKHLALQLATVEPQAVTV